MSDIEKLNREIYSITSTGSIQGEPSSNCTQSSRLVGDDVDNSTAFALERSEQELKSFVQEQKTSVEKNKLQIVGKYYYDTQMKYLESDEDVLLPEIEITRKRFAVANNQVIKHIKYQDYYIKKIYNFRMGDLLKMFAYHFYKNKYKNKVQIIFRSESGGLRTKLLPADKVNYLWLKWKLITCAEEQYSMGDKGFKITVREVSQPSGGSIKKGTKYSKIRFNVPFTEYCGQACLVYHMKDHKYLKKFPHRWLKQAKKLDKDLGINNSKMTINDFDKVKDKGVHIFDENKKIIYRSDKLHQDNIYLWLSNEHYFYIPSFKSFINNGTSKDVCKYCFKTFAYNVRHMCKKIEHCFYCGLAYESYEDKLIHKVDICNKKCDKCNITIKFSKCYDIHTKTCHGNYWCCDKCTKLFAFSRKESHICGEKRCNHCNIYYIDNHRCYVKPLAGRDMNIKYYAYDIESTLNWTPAQVVLCSDCTDCTDASFSLNENSATKDKDHQFSILVLQELYTGAEKIFYKLEDFYEFIQSLGKSKLYAHNAQGYDAYLLYQWLWRDFKIKPTKFIRKGKKVLYMAYGPVEFHDSMAHIKGSLNSLIDTFNLKDNIGNRLQSKEYFPYNFYSTENKNYIGEIPHKKYFNCAKCDICCSRSRQDAVNCCSSSDCTSPSSSPSSSLKDSNNSSKPERLSNNNSNNLNKGLDKVISVNNDGDGVSCKCIHFDKWYQSYNCTDQDGLYTSSKSERLSNNYNINEECVNYCRRDVLILRKALECYKDAGIKLNNKNPLQNITIASYCMRVFRSNFLKDNTIGVLSKYEYNFAREALQGGRTNNLAFYHKGPMRYIDVVSLYPSVQRNNLFPIGFPTIDKAPFGTTGLNEIIMAYKNSKPAKVALIACDVECPQDLYIPLLLHKTDKLLADCIKKEGSVYTSVELCKAIELGYKITHIYEIHTYDTSDSLFTKYIDHYFKIKNETSGGQKNIAKLMLNSLWGKFAQRDDVVEDLFVNIDEFLKYCKGDTVEDFDEIAKDKFHLIICKNIEDLHISYANPAISAFVTSYARLKLYSVLEVLQKKVLYFDTDSVIYKGEQVIPESKELGCWELESELDEFVAIAPKSYAYRSKGVEVVKSKGFSTDITFDNYKEIVDTHFDPNAGDCSYAIDSFYMKRTAEGIKNTRLIKKLSFIYNKRKIISVDETVPFTDSARS
jgi:hypothetical protein